MNVYCTLYYLDNEANINQFTENYCLVSLVLEVRGRLLDGSWCTCTLHRHVVVVTGVDIIISEAAAFDALL